MSINTADGQEGIANLEPRDVRALTEYLTVIDDVGRAKNAENLYLVVSESGREYLVDARNGTCECPDHRHRGVECKHQKRTAYATGRRPIPNTVTLDAIDGQVGMHVNGTPRVAMTDGGVVEIEGDDVDNDDCDCDDLPDGFPCWDCIRDGRKEFPD